MSKFTKIKNHPDLVKDLNSGAIININTTKLDAEREKLKKQRQKNEEFENLKNEVGEIKNLLYQLLEKSSNDKNS